MDGQCAPRQTLISLGLVVLSVFLSAWSAFGATITVTNTSDSGAGSLREAIASAANGDTINFALTYPATITVATPLTFGPSVTITGPGASNLTISGADSVAVFIVNTGATVEISGLTVAHGSSVLGGGILNAATLTLDSVTVSNCTLGNQLGGGIFNSGTLNLNNSEVDGNVAGANGSPGVFGAGGGIYSNSGRLTLTNSDVSNNQSLGGSVSATDTGVGAGGGIYVNSGVLVVNGGSIDGNFGGTGGGVVNLGTATITNSTVSGNSSYFGGNGIFTGNTATITGSTISGNTTAPSTSQVGVQTDNLGGGIDTGGTLTVTNSTIWGNSVIVGNIAGHSGIGNSGGIGGTGEVNLAFVTIADNTGGIFLFGGFGAPTVLTIKGSILATNQTNGADILNCSIAQIGASGVSDGFNLSDDASCAGFFAQAGDLNSTPADLDPGGLKNNGGSTQTVALLAGGPAVNAIPVSPMDCTDTNGNAVTTDQRGAHRPLGGRCDIGAFELFQSRLPIPAVETMLLIAQVQSPGVPRGAQLVLVVPLQAALDFINAGVMKPASDLIGGFIDLVGLAERARVLTAQQAAPLVTSAQHIISELSGAQ